MERRWCRNGTSLQIPYGDRLDVEAFLRRHGYKGRWHTIAFGLQYVAEDGLVLTWFPKNSRVVVQGNTEAAQRFLGLC